MNQKILPKGRGHHIYTIGDELFEITDGGELYIMHFDFAETPDISTTVKYDGSTDIAESGVSDVSSSEIDEFLNKYKIINS